MKQNARRFNKIQQDLTRCNKMQQDATRFNKMRNSFYLEKFPDLETNFKIHQNITI